jgi:queuine tRNA-ribosyltransferase
MSRLGFQLEATAKDSRARAGRFRTLHNEVVTPVFMPVGTQATVKSQTVESLGAVGSQVLLANTYHLLLRPGPEVFRAMGGIHRFMNWNKSVLTDSGGYQIFSLPHSRKMTEDGAEFQSYVDGKRILLSPELSIETQKAIGSDIMMVLDQCIPSTADHKQAAQAMELTHRWAARSLKARGDSQQALFGIVQGACFPDLRKASADFLTAMPFDGFAIGGLAVGESKALREDFTELAAGLLPTDRPRYLMGVGTPIDLLEAVHRGVDMFDCILPTALAQRGSVFTSKGYLQLRRGVYKFADEKLDPACACSTCAHYSKSYLHHLVKTEEVLGWQLLGFHNLHFYQELMREMRAQILAGTFYAYYLAMREQLQRTDEEKPSSLPKPPRAARAKKNQLGDFEVHVSANGHASIRQKSSGEVMHSVNDPEVEAERLYIGQSRLRERLSQDGPSELVIWDVGLGAAINAMAAIRAHEELGATRPLHIVSFEKDLDPLKLALRHPGVFAHLRHPAPSALLREGKWRSKTGFVSWSLVEGDFLETMRSARLPDLIFYDPFSFKTDSALWSLSCFSELHARIKAKDSELYTYSGSTAVRATLLASGFWVARGESTGKKAETTIAYSGPAIRSGLLAGLLGKEWLGRWERSDSRLPLGVAENSGFSPAIAMKLIRDHAQFSLATAESEASRIH